jgi:hypothetical protein
LDVSSAGTVRVAIGSEVYTATGIANLRSGDTFDVRIRFSQNTVFLDRVAPFGATIEHTVFTALGLPQTPISSFLVTFFTQIGSRVEPQTIRNIMKLASRFHGKEIHAAEAAAILSERGIAINDETVSLVVDLIEGKSFGDEPEGNQGSEKRQYSESHEYSPHAKRSGRALCAFVNQKKGSCFHWVIIPFNRPFANTRCSGSIRFLLDTETGKTVETRISFYERLHMWEFSIKDRTCAFTANPGFSSVEFGKFVVYLKGVLPRSSVSDVVWYLAGESPKTMLKSIDLEI